MGARRINEKFDEQARKIVNSMPQQLGAGDSFALEQEIAKALRDVFYKSLTEDFASVWRNIVQEDESVLAESAMAFKRHVIETIKPPEDHVMDCLGVVRRARLYRVVIEPFNPRRYDTHEAFVLLPPIKGRFQKKGSIAKEPSP